MSLLACLKRRETHLSAFLLGIALIWFAILLVFSFGLWFYLPAPVLDDLENNASFSEIRARKYLEQLDYPHRAHTWGVLRAQRILLEELNRIVNAADKGDYVKIHYQDTYPLNVWAVIEGTSGAPDVKNTFLVNAHYDTQDITPGAQDNNAGVVTILETFNNIINSPQPKIPCIFLWNGDEESGFLGIKSFLQEPIFQSVAGFLNFDGREGHKSVLFRTTGSYLDDFYKAHAPYPFGSSVTDDVIHNSPVTDFYVLAGIDGIHNPLPGFDIGFIDAPQTYHTSQDCASHVASGALQAEGSNTLAFLRAVLNVDRLPANPDMQRRVYFDIFGVVLVSYTRTVSLIITLLFLAANIGLFILYTKFSNYPLRRTITPTLMILAGWFVGLLVAVGMGLLANAVNAFFYDGNIVLGLGVVASSCILFTALFHCCIELLPCVNSYSRNLPLLYHALLGVLVIFLVVSCILAMFLSATYFVLCLVFPVDIAIFCRLLLHRFGVATLFHPERDALDRVIVKVSSSEDEETGLIQKQGPSAGGQHQQSQREETFRDYLFDILVFLLCSVGSVMLIMGVYVGIGSTTSFPEAGVFQAPLFCALTALFVSLCLVVITPLAIRLRWVLVALAAVMLIAFLIPSFVVYPFNSSYHPIRVTATVDYEKMQLNLSATDGGRDDRHFEESILSLPYFKDNLINCESSQCVFEDESLFNMNISHTYKNLGEIGNNWKQLVFNFTTLPTSLRTDLEVKGDIRELTVLDGGEKGFYNEAYWKVGFEQENKAFIVEFQGVLKIHLTSRLNYEYSRGISELMCVDKNLMLDSYSITFIPPVYTVTILDN